jgi:hypothetical protein
LVVLGCAIVTGTVLEGITPSTILHETPFSVSPFSEEVALRNTFLFAKPFRLIVKIQTGESIDFAFSLIAGGPIVVQNSTTGFTTYGTLHARGLYEVTLYNPTTNATTITVSFVLYGVDHQQVVFGYLLFGLGLIFSVICLVIEVRTSTMNANHDNANSHSQTL